jgi:hypothetical protein
MDRRPKTRKGWTLFVGEMQVRLGISNQSRDEWQGGGHELGGGWALVDGGHGADK